MKRIITMLMAVLMISSVLPLSIPAAGKSDAVYEKTTGNASALSESSASQFDNKELKVRNAYTANDITAKKESVQNICLDDVNPAYRTLKASDFEQKSASWKASPRIGLEMMDPDTTFLGGYWLDKESSFAIADDWYTSGAEAYIQIMHPSDPSEGSDSNGYHLYEKGETVWFNWGIYKTFDTGSGELIPLTLGTNEKGKAVSCYCFAGTYDAWTGSEEGDGIVMVNAWKSGSSQLSCKMTAPEDDYMYMFVFVVDDTSMTEFGSWVSISYSDLDFKDINISGELTVGKNQLTKISGPNTQLVLAPWSNQSEFPSRAITNSYFMTYAAAYSIEMVSNEKYVVTVDSDDSIGIHMWLCDENMDVLNETYVGPVAIANGTPYSNSYMAALPVVSGTYYVVIGGFYMGDDGDVNINVMPWNEVATPLPNVNQTINLDNLNTENIIKEQDGKKLWGYFWHQEYGLGELIILYPGTYTVTGSNPNIFCDVYDSINLILKNATIGAIWFSNTYSSSQINSIGTSTISDTYFGETIYNYEGCNSGIYLGGDELIIEGKLGIITDATPVHIGTKTLEVETTGIEGSYPIALWVTGKNNPQLTLGKNASFEDSNQKATMYYDGDGNNVFGYTVSQHAELYRLHNEPNLFEAVTSFKLTTNGYSTAPRCVVTFIDGLDNSVIAKKEVEKGASAVPPTPPVHAGYTFDYWDGSYSNVTSDVTVTARYKINSYKLTYYVDNTIYAEETHKYGEAITPLPDPPARDGYIFSGWNYIPTSMPANDVRVDGKFINENETIYSVTFIDGFDNSIIAVVKVAAGTSAAAPAVPEHEGYTFKKWDKDFSSVNSDLTVTALYEVNYYTVTFVDYDGRIIDTQSVEYGHSATAPTPPERPGYLFSGWDVDFTCVKRDLTVTAQYIEEQAFNLGDVNMDGKINTGDAVAILKHAADLVKLTPAQMVLADVNRDTAVNTGDAVTLLKYAAGMITAF